MDTRIMRFPGGSSSDVYHWQTNLVDGSTYAGVSFDQFETQLALPNHIQTMITLNYGDASVSEAQAWVAYSVSKNYNVKYWEVGNECYGNWENDTHAHQWDPLTYGQQAVLYINAVKQADPTARVGVVLGVGEDAYPAAITSEAVTNPVTHVSHFGWDPIVLATMAKAGVYPDFVIYHRYEQQPSQENDGGLMSVGGTTAPNAATVPGSWADISNELQAELTDYLGQANAAKVEVLNTENNSVSYNPGKQTTSLVNGLYMADSLGYVASQTNFNGWIWWDLYNGNTQYNNGSNLYGWRQYGDYGVIQAPNSQTPATTTLYFPTYYVQKILGHFARQGDQVVSATSTLTRYLDVFAAKRADGSLSLLVINKSIPTTNNGQTLTANFTLNGFTPAAAATEYQYGTAQDTQAQTDTANSTNAFADAAADVQTSTVSISGPTFSLAFPAASVTLLSIPPAQAASSSDRLVNISSNGYVNGTTNELDAGFFVSGPVGSTETVLIRGIGPALTGFGVSGAATNVNLTVYSAANNNAVIATNNGWSGGSQANTTQLQNAFSSTGAFGLPVGSMDSAVILQLAPGSYTATVNGVGTVSGTAVAEVYEVTSSGNARLLNISCRGLVDSSGHMLTDGFYIAGTGGNQEQVLIRGVGPGLSAFLSSYVADPALKLFTAGSPPVEIAANDDWSDSATSGMNAAFAATYAFGLTPMSRDAGLLITLPPGGYTAQVYGTDGPGGDALVEIYEVPQH
ncbi:MAG TPA: hypothetical protein VGL42_09310 [Opitutaceae bacterium]